MKKGFLNTDKAKQKLSEVTDSRASEPPTSKDEGKAKAKTDTEWHTQTDATNPDMPRLDLHSIPSIFRSAEQHEEGHERFIFRQWPRDPNGKSLLPSPLRGKEAGNHLDLWGATLYDFFYVNRIPSIPNSLTISTGSKLAKAMRAFGELGHAKNEFDWADREADPKVIPVWDPAKAIAAYERRVHAGSNKQEHILEKSSATPEVDVEMLNVSDADADLAILDGAVNVTMDAPGERPSELRCKSVDPTNDPGVQHLPADLSLESPFHSSHYPSPWPLVPFESPYTPFNLQQRIPIHLLPKKLYVHDPWSLVCTNRDPDLPDEEEEILWKSKTDHVRSYTLALPLELQSVAEEAASEDIVFADDESAEIIFIPPQETQGPTEQPALRVFLPEKPRRPTEVPEAHLYLSPKCWLGAGHHSIVYMAELELPRDLFCKSTYCKACLDEQIKVEVDRLKQSGVWEKELNAAANAGRYKPRNFPSSSSARLSPRYVGAVHVRLEHFPAEEVGLVGGTTANLGEIPIADAQPERLARVHDGATNRHITYEGLIVPIYPNIQWQDPTRPETICKHRAATHKPVPRTAIFRVAAKLSVPRDSHLVREANSYLKFPAHFFQHWSGYNVVPPVRDPTPVGALVPQFFGYYTPDALPDSDPNSNSKSVSGEDEDEEKHPFFSPILLLEQCGTPISISKLCTDDRNECATLLFRFHAAGWLHGSFAERNILMQKRRPTCSPLGEGEEEEEERLDLLQKHGRYGFRLIDFGRSVECDAAGRAGEESEGRILFGLL